MNRRQRRAAHLASSRLTVMDAAPAVNPAQTAAGAFGLAHDAIALDAFSNLAARMGAGSSSVAEGVTYSLIRWSLDYMLMVTLYRNHWIARRIVEGVAQDMTRTWCKLACDLTPEQINSFERTIMRTQTKMRIQTAIKWARLFGGAGCLIVIDGHEDILDQPLDFDEINPGTYKGLIAFDRWSGISPGTEIGQDINRPHDFGLPLYYDVKGTDGNSTLFRVHSSRILRFTGPDVPSPEYQAQQRWGISALEPVFEELRKRDNASWSILQLMFKAQIITQVNPELAQLLSGAVIGGKGLEQFAKRMQIQNEMLSNNSQMILGKDASLETHQFSFSGLGDIYQQFQLDIAGAAESTVTRIFGRTLSGLGSTNDADEKVYEERIDRAKHEELKPQLEKLYPVICMSEFGFVPDDLDMSFPSAHVLTEKEKSEMAKSGGELIVAVFGAGLITERQALMELKALSEVTGVFTNITDEDVAAASDDKVALPQDMPGAGGEGDDEGGDTSAKPSKGKDAAPAWFAALVSRLKGGDASAQA